MYYGPSLQSEHMYQLPSGAPPVYSESAKPTDFASIVGTFWRRRRVFYSIFLTFLGAVVIWTLLAPKTYTATTKMIAGSSNLSTPARQGDTSLPMLNALIAASTTHTAETYAELLQENPIAAQVERDLHLKISGKTLLDKYISIKPITNTAVIALSATWSNRDTASKIANEFATVFVNRERELIASQAGSALDFLSKQMPVAEAAMHAADGKLAQFQASHPNVYIGGTGQGAGSSVAAAQQRFAQAQVDQQQAQAQLANVTGQMTSLSPTINGSSNINQNPVVAQLQIQLAQINVQLESARKQFTEQHPTVVALEEQKAQIQREIQSQPASIVSGNNIVPNPVYQQLSQTAATLRSQIASDQSQLATLRSQMGSPGSAQNLPRETFQLADLQRKATLAEDVYTALQNKYNDATVAKTASLSDIAITQLARPGDETVKPNLPLNLLLGFILGLVLAISGVFLVDFFDNTFKDEQDVQRALALPLLASVPQLTTKTPHGLPWLRALTVESFLQLVTALRYSSDKPLRTLAITSPHQGDGKSTVALSTAIAMAEMEPKVLLVDADLRKPSLHTKLGMENERGLSDYLVGAGALGDVIKSTKFDGLYLLSSGGKVPNPIKLIQSARFNQLITELLKEYRAIVFDTPALLPVFDAAIIGSAVDGTVLVVSAGVTDMPSTKAALQRLNSLHNVNLIGVVLNRVTPTNGYRAYYLADESPISLPHESEEVV